MGVSAACIEALAALVEAHEAEDRATDFAGRLLARLNLDARIGQARSALRSAELRSDRAADLEPVDIIDRLTEETPS